MSTKSKSNESKMSIETAKIYLSVLLATVSSIFQRIGLAIMAAFEAASNRILTYMGLNALVATTFQIYLAIVTSGASLLLAPFMIALDVVTLTGLMILLDTTVSSLYKGIKFVGGLILSHFNAKAATKSHKRAYARTAGMAAVH